MQARQQGYIAVDTLAHLLAVHITPADEQERAQVDVLCDAVQQATGETVKLHGQIKVIRATTPCSSRQTHGSDLQIVKLADAKKGFVPLPRRRVVEPSFGWLSRFRRLTRDYERLPSVLSGLHFLVFAILMLSAATKILEAGSS